MPGSAGSRCRRSIYRLWGRVSCTVFTWSLAHLGPRVGRSSVACMGRSHGAFESHGGLAAGMRRPPGGASSEGLRGSGEGRLPVQLRDRKSTRLNSSHGYISYAVFCLKKKKKDDQEGLIRCMSQRYG